MPIKLLVSAAKQFLTTHLSPNLTYHSLQHTNTVIDYSLLFAKNESYSYQDQQLVALAAAYHDTGFCVMPNANEPAGAFLLNSAIYYLLTNQRLQPTYYTIAHAYDSSDLTPLAYQNKCIAMRDSLITIIEQLNLNQPQACDIGRGSTSNAIIEIDTELAEFLRRMEALITSTALLQDANGNIYRTPSEKIAESLLDADLSGFGRSCYSQDFSNLIAEKELQTFGQRISFAHGSVRLLQGHHWFTAAAHKMFHEQQRLNLEWTEQFISECAVKNSIMSHK